MIRRRLLQKRRVRAGVAVAMIVVFASVAAACGVDRRTTPYRETATTQTTVADNQDLVPRLLSAHDAPQGWTQIEMSNEMRSGDTSFACPDGAELLNDSVANSAATGFLNRSSFETVAEMVSPASREDYDKVVAATDACVNGLNAPADAPDYSYEFERLDTAPLGDASAAYLLTEDAMGTKAVIRLVFGYHDGVFATVMHIAPDGPAAGQLSDEEFDALIKAASVRLTSG